VIPPSSIVFFSPLSKRNFVSFTDPQLSKGNIFFFIVVLGRVHCGIYEGFYNVSNISYLNSPSPLLPIPGTISAGIIFAFTCTCTHFLHCIHSSTPPSLPPPPSHWCQPSPWAGPALPSCSLILQKIKKIKRKT
jgi:hypothetical protein